MQLKCEVQRILCDRPVANEEPRAWYLLKTDQGTACGEILWRPAEGEKLLLEGEWNVRSGDRQFKFKDAMLDIPSDPRDQLRYVCAKAKGVGEALELAIWDKWGADWWERAEADVIPRLNGKAFVGLRNAMNEFKLKRDESRAISWLIGKGATLGLAAAAWERWEKTAIGVVQDNCFILADLPRYGFGDVDRLVRRNFDIADDDPRRVTAAVVYAMQRETEWGATLVGWDKLLAAVGEEIASFENLRLGTRDKHRRVT